MFSISVASVQLNTVQLNITATDLVGQVKSHISGHCQSQETKFIQATSSHFHSGGTEAELISVHC